MGGVEPALFATAFEMSRVGTICEHAELETEDRGRALGLRRLRRRDPARRALLRLRVACGAPATLAGGDEIVLERIDLEVP